MAGDGQSGLPSFQLEVARARPTEDLDFFTAPERGHVPAARDALEAAAC